MPLSDHYPELAGWVPAPDTAVPPPQVPVAEIQVSPYLRAPLPLPLQYAPDTLKQYNRPGLSSYRTAPLPPNSVPNINATSQGVAQNVTKTVVNTVVNGAISTLTFTPVPNQFLTGISSTGVTAAQPSFANISGVAAPSQLPNPGPTSLGGIESFAATPNTFLTQISTSGAVTGAQPLFSNIAGTLTIGQIGASGSPNSSNFLRGDYTWAVPPGGGGSTPAVQAFYNKSYGGANVGILPNTQVAVLFQSVTMPVSGGPFRVLVTYGINLTSSSSELLQTKVDDGANIFATAGAIETGSFTYGFIGGSGVSPVTYANGATVGFTLTIECNNGGMSYTSNGFFSGFQNTYLQITVLTSV